MKKENEVLIDRFRIFLIRGFGRDFSKVRDSDDSLISNNVLQSTQTKENPQNGEHRGVFFDLCLACA